MRGLSDDQLATFEREGYLLAEGVLDAALDLAPVLDEYSVVLREIEAGAAAEGLLDPADLVDLDFDQRFQAVAVALGKSWFQEFDISLPTTVEADSAMHRGAAVFDLITNERLLDVVESIVGPEVESNPVQHVRIMLPADVSRRANPGVPPMVTPWHQDQGVLMPEADDTPLLTVWSPLVDAPVERGCLQVVPRSHKHGLLQHCQKNGLSIPDELLPGDPTPVPMKAGDVLLMDRRTVHASMPNTSEHVRWSFDLRYQPPGYPSGRPAFPSFLVRSEAHRSSVVTTHHEWEQAWIETQARLSGSTAPVFYRWGTTDPACA